MARITIPVTIIGGEAEKLTLWNGNTLHLSFTIWNEA
jgi:hypothetical protein